MTKKQKEVHKIIPFLVQKEVKIWGTGQKATKGAFQKEPMIVGTIAGATEILLMLKNVTMSNGKKLDTFDISIGSIGKIIQKN